MNSIVTLTMNPSLDKSTELETLKIDTKLRLAGLRKDPGGGGINVSRALRKLGGTSTAVYLEGGCEGEFLSRRLDSEGVTSRPIPITGAIRESLTFLETSTGHQYRLSMPGPKLTREELRRVEKAVKELIEPGTIFVASGSLPEGTPADFYVRLGEIAAAAEARYIVDTSGDFLKRVLDSTHLYLIKPNLRELALLTGRERLEQPDMREAALQLVERDKVEHVVVSLGAAGAYLVNADGSRKFNSPSVPVDSRIGAGDSMVAGIVKALVESKDPVEAVRRGVAAGAAAVMTPGTELCRREDAERIYQEVEVFG